MDRRFRIPVPSGLKARLTYEDQIIHLYEFSFPECPISKFGSTGLHEWAINGDVQALRKALTSSRSSVDVVDKASGVTPLVAACSEGKYAAAQTLIEFGADVNHKCRGTNDLYLRYSGVTPVYVAACSDRSGIIDLLLENGADVNQKCYPTGYTPLHCAVKKCNLRSLASLMKCPNIDVNTSCYNGRYPIHTAVQNPHVLQELLSLKHINPNVTYSYEKITPLHLAVYERQFESVKLLIFRGVDVNARLECGLTPLDLAVQKNHQRIVLFLKDAGGIRSVQKESRIWLTWADAVDMGPGPMKCKMGNDECLESPLIGGSTALHIMVVHGNAKACELLLTKGAKVDHADHIGRTPLHIAAAINHLEIAKLLLKYQAPINIQTSVGFTPVHIAAVNGSLSTLQFLISQGANVHIKDFRGGTALFPAIAQGDPKVVRALLNNGADPNEKALYEVFEVSALHMACSVSACVPDVIKELIKAGADVNERAILCCGARSMTPLHSLVKNESGYCESFRALVEAGSFIDAEATSPADEIVKVFGFFADPAKRNPLSCIPDKETAEFRSNTMELFKAVRKNDLDLTRRLYFKGATVNCCSQKYDTPLVYASWKGYTAMVKLLLAKGANVDMSCPLHYAAKFNRKDIVIELLRHRADIKKISSGKTALEIAQEKNNLEVVLLLKLAGSWIKFTKQTHLMPLPDFKSCRPLMKIVKELEGEVSEDDLRTLFQSSK